MDARDSRKRVPRGVILTQEALPTPPDSPAVGEVADMLKAKPPPPALALAAGLASTDGEHQEKKQKEQDNGNATLTAWRRITPVFLSVQDAMQDLGYHMLYTNGHNNSCMLFAYLLCTGELSESDQGTR